MARRAPGEQIKHVDDRSPENITYVYVQSTILKSTFTCLHQVLMLRSCLCYCGLYSLRLLRFDDETDPGSFSRIATAAGCNVPVARPADVIECPDGDRHSGEGVVVGQRVV